MKDQLQREGLLESHPWANALKADAQVQSMVKELRTQARKRRLQPEGASFTQALARPSVAGGQVVASAPAPDERPLRSVWRRRIGGCWLRVRACLHGVICTPCALLPVFFLYAAFSALSCLFVHSCCVETRGCTLDEIEKRFAALDDPKRAVEEEGARRPLLDA